MSRRRTYFRTVLDNGIRVVAEQIPDVKSVSLGVWVGVGSRDEEDRLAGISHFIEHMFFKGTRRRSAGRIAREIDGLGGELNAFTSRENTTFYVKVLDEHLIRAVDLMGDIFHHSLFDSSEIEKEKQVILQEIKMAEDDPEDLVHELHTQNVWKGNALGRSILGEAKTVAEMTRSDLMSHLRRSYSPDRIVIAAAGNFGPSGLFRQFDRVFGRFRAEAPLNHRVRPIGLNGRILLRKKKLEQVHVCIGMKGLPLNHPDRYGIQALNALLGGGMSSRLFQEVREKRGLVYTIYSHASGFHDAGLFTIYAATSKAAVNRLLKVVLRELARLRNEGVGRAELDRTLAQMKGHIMLGLESTDSRMGRLAKDEIYFGRHYSLRQTLSGIEKVTSRQVHRLAEELLDPKELSLTILGPVRSVPQSIRSVFSS
jgi:predicted Zn-dependent peptidase